MAKVTVYPAVDGVEEVLEFHNVKQGQVTFVDNESHGQGPIGSLDEIERGGQRLIIASPNVVAVFLEADD